MVATFYWTYRQPRKERGHLEDDEEATVEYRGHRIEVRFKGTSRRTQGSKFATPGPRLRILYIDDRDRSDLYPYIGGSTTEIITVAKAWIDKQPPTDP